MKAIKQTVFQVLALTVLGTIVAFTANAVRGSGSIRFTKNYFATGAELVQRPQTRGDAQVFGVEMAEKSQTTSTSASETTASKAQEPADDGTPAGRVSDPAHDLKTQEPADGGTRASDSDTSPTLSAPPADEREYGEADAAPAEADAGTDQDTGQWQEDEAHIDHPYQGISTQEAFAFYNDPNLGLSLFVDARNDHAFEEGHVPGAVQVDPYRIEDYIDPLLELEPAVDRLIVYCNGGDCEDSIFLCRDLIYDYGIAYDKVFLYEGGWKGWTKHGLPVEKGRP